MLRDIAELQTGQVAFLSSLLAGFALTIAAQILRHGLRHRMAQAVFLSLILTTLLFLIALYVDVRLTIELAGLSNIDPKVAVHIATVREIGTHCATLAFTLFILSIGLLGWLGNKLLGLITSILAALTIGLLFYVWMNINMLQGLLAG